MKPIIRLAVVIVAAAAVFAASAPADDPPEFGAWSVPLNLGPIVNSATDYDGCPTLARDGLSLFFRSNRAHPDRVPGAKDFDIWVAQRASVEDWWDSDDVTVERVAALSTTANEYCTALSPDQHWMMVMSDRPSGNDCSRGQDLFVTRRQDKRDNFEWEPPQNLGCPVNSAGNEHSQAYFEDPDSGELKLYFATSRDAATRKLEIYEADAIGGEKYLFGAPRPVTELNSDEMDLHVTIRKDGLEVIFVSTRGGGSGGQDLWVSTRASTADPWSAPTNVGSAVNSPSNDFRPSLSFDGTTLIFASERQGVSDLYMCTRERNPNRR